MPEQVIMPRLSDTMTEGTVAKWLKHPGETVKKGEPLVEIETDKATIELEAYASGTLAKILLQEGQKAPVGDPIGEIALAGETPGNRAAVSAGSPLAAAAAVVEGKAAAAAVAEAPPARQAIGEREEGEVRASPMARRLARELGVDLSTIHGSGPLGRIQKEDVEAAAAPEAPAAATPAPRPAVPATAPTGPDVEAVSMSVMQQTIARRMAEAKATTPHFYVSMEADMRAAVEVLDGLNDGLPKEEHITINDLILKACAAGLKAFPEVNSFYQDGRLYRHKRVHVGLAVAIPNGLIVPVVRDADQKNLRQIAAETKALVRKMRDGKAEPADYSGGTFSISNLGMYGVEEFVAIINPPQSAILAIGTVADKPVVRDGQLGISKRAMLTLSADHRVFYGATAAEFLRDVKSKLERPLSLILS